MTFSDKTIERLLLYRVLLMELKEQGKTHIHSHELAELANNSPAQVRRDIMGTGYAGMPVRGYEIAPLIKTIKKCLNLNFQTKIALIGIGNLGSAILSFFREHSKQLKLIAAFETDPQKINTTIAGCKTYAVEQIAEVVRKNNITIGMIATPAQAAQESADRLVEAGIKGILNFTSVPLKVPENIKLIRIDITIQLEKLAFFSR